MDARFDDVGTFDDDGGDDSVLDFFLSRSISECSDVLARFNSERSDVPGGVGSCFEIGTQEIGILRREVVSRCVFFAVTLKSSFRIFLVSFFWW